ncbi:MAG: HDOD domain-containing protein [Chromatiales bacterium]|jgi:putative nucleotidyltransferase with HDIG domain|nr:HDOD domain-containing protein [Chromatiales bacterium]MDX9765719.1 HDOD domain-containing protein [Ectothiorhodospiraceae bacterium]
MNTRPSLDGVLRGLKDLATFPDLYHRLEQVMSNPTSSLDDMAAVVEQDVAVASKLLRLANSSFYSFPSRIQSVGRAITIIGTKQLRDLVLATLVIKRFDGIPTDMVDMEGFWRHSIGCAIIARVIAIFRREANVERFYVSGLLHDLGRLVMLLQVQEPMREVFKQRQQEQSLLFQTEAAMLGFDHAVLGAELLRSWQLPKVFEEAVKYHHAPLMAGGYPVEAAVVHAADSIAHAMQLGTSGEKYVPPIDPKAWERIGLSESMLAQVVAFTDQQYHQAVEIFLR